MYLRTTDFRSVWNSYGGVCKFTSFFRDYYLLWAAINILSHHDVPIIIILGNKHITKPHKKSL